MEALFTPAQLAAALGLKTQTVYNRHSQGGDLPPAVKLGHALRFRPADVEAWIDRQRQPSQPAPTPAPAPIPRRRGRPTKQEQIARRAAVSAG